MKPPSSLSDKKKSTDWELDLQIIHQLGPIKKKLDLMFHHGQEDTKKKPLRAKWFSHLRTSGQQGIFWVVPQNSLHGLDGSQGFGYLEATNWYTLW